VHGKEDVKKGPSKEEKEAQVQEIENKKAKFRNFLKAIGKSKDNKQSWNDNFAAFMADDGSGLLHTSKAGEEEKKKKRKQKEEDKHKEETQATE
jgi:hypothetical protein